MNRRAFLYLGPGLRAIRRSACAFATGESPEPIPEAHFPGRLYQFVWRNWELANVDRMAAVIRTTPETVLRLGSSMGLPKKRHLTDDQLARLYITLIRQNWHLLPESQIIELLGWDRQKFDFILKEDDFLDVKLGMAKPRCDELIYRTPSEREKAAAEEIRRTVREVFGQTIDRQGEDLFAFVRDLSETRYLPARDPQASAGKDEIDLSRGWGIVAADSLEAAGLRFAGWLQSAMGAQVASGRGPKNIHLELGSGLEGGREAFRIEVDEREVRILGNDEAGVLQGIYLLQDRMEEREGPFLRRGTLQHKTVWNPRYLYSYFALYGDPLMDTERDPFPDAYLEKLARRGINGVWIQAVLNTLAPSKQFPEFGAGWETRLKNLDALARRAKRLGLRVYLYLNEPRAMPGAFFQKRPEMRGAPHGNLYAMCTSVPAVREWLADSLANVVRHAPDLGGIYCITMSENLTNCFSKGDAWGKKAPVASDCPRCSQRKSWDVIAEVIVTMRNGVRRHSGTADVIAWDWGWGDELTDNLLPLLPKDVRLLSEPGVGEFVLSVVDPGPRSLRNWERARTTGLTTMAKVQFNNTWEISAVPYIPVMHLVLDHCENFAKAGVSGIVASWTCGGYASPNLAVAKPYYFEPRPSKDEVLNRAAVQRYGKRAASIVVQAWKQFSDAFVKYPYRIGDVSLTYIVPTQHGPANPLRIRPTGYRAAMILFPYDDYKGWCGRHSPEAVQKGFAVMAALWKEGLATFRRVVPVVPAHKKRFAELDLAIAETCYYHFQSTANQLEFCILREKIGDRAARARMRRIAEEEIELARRQFPIARDQSVIAYEASNHYFYTPLDLVEKVLNCSHVIRELDRQA
ncbi:MAG: hypothetical protein OZ929_12165 [Bryobacterales bacterium]|nr:hypothetical protein [Bryobacterales bacterium]